MNKQTDVLKFLGSPRGQYIVGQALAIAVKELEKVEPELQEKSNIADMKFLGEQLFKAGYATHTMLSKELLNQIQTQLGNDPGGPNGAPLYIEAPGSASVTPTGTTGHVARVIGYHYGARQVYFNPDNTWIVV